METKELKFKTNINCSGCVSKVKPFLDKNNQIDSWEVDTNSENKILLVKTELNKNDVIDIIEEIGFTAETIDS